MSDGLPGDDYGEQRRERAAFELNCLLSCPFCGGSNIDPAMVRGYKAGDSTQPVIAAGCWDCGATGATVDVPDHSTGYVAAAEAWNRRAR